MAEPGARTLVLASASPFRKRMLEAAGLAFRVVPADIDESHLKHRLAAQGPAAVAEALACAKAEAVSARLPEALVLGADQVLALGEELFDKPGDLRTVRAQLVALRGKTHRLLTAVALAQRGRVVWTLVETATLTIRSFSDAFLDGYIAQSGTALCHIVGAYEIEGRGAQLFERVEGDHFTIIGLPLVPLLAELRSRGVIET